MMMRRMFGCNGNIREGRLLEKRSNLLSTELRSLMGQIASQYWVLSFLGALIRSSDQGFQVIRARNDVRPGVWDFERRLNTESRRRDRGTQSFFSAEKRRKEVEERCGAYLKARAQRDFRWSENGRRRKIQFGEVLNLLGFRFLTSKVFSF